MKIGLGKDLICSNIYDADDKSRKKIYSRLEVFLKSLNLKDIKCVGKYKNGLSMDFCEICSEMNILSEVVKPYEENDSSWPAPIKNKFKKILKKSKNINLLCDGGFNPKKMKEMDSYVEKMCDLLINVEVINNRVIFTLVRKNEHKIFESLIH